MLKQPFISIFLVFILISSVFLVEHANFKTCNQSSFCRQNRQLIISQSKWEIDANLVRQTGDHLGVEATIKNAENGA